MFILVYGSISYTIDGLASLRKRRFPLLLLDDLSRVHTLVKKGIGASAIEEKPTKPEDQGADAQPH